MATVTDNSRRGAPDIFERIFALLPQPAVVSDRSGTVLAANAALFAQLGLQPEEILSKPFSDICEPIPADLSSLIGTRCPIRLRTGSGARAGVLWNLSVSDLGTPGKELWCTLTPPSESSLQQQKLESLGILAGSVAHDLNNVLTSVLGHISFLRLSIADNRPIDDSVHAIEDGARRAATITQKILDFSRVQEVSFEPVKLGKVAESAVKLLSKSMPANVVLNIEVRDPEVCVLGDEGQLGQVLMNLAINARDALSRGGTIHLMIDSVTIDIGQTGAVSVDAGEYAIVRISDNGPGVPEEIRKRIFEPFFTTKEGRGTGLGLAIVSSIVKVHGGAVTLESSPSKGTVFCLYFPKCFSTETPARQTEVETIPRGTERILVVDDEESVRTIVQRSLEHLGYEVSVAKNGEEALLSYAKDPKSFALVIIDMIMPNMAGDELFIELQRINREVSVLIASGYSSDGRTRSILEHGGLGFIQKPFAVEELAREVRRCLDLASAKEQ